MLGAVWVVGAVGGVGGEGAGGPGRLGGLKILSKRLQKGLRMLGAVCVLARAVTQGEWGWGRVWGRIGSS